MSMIKRATGKIEKFTDADGDEVNVTASVDQQSEDANLVWAEAKIKDAIDVDTVADITLDINNSDDDDETIAKDC